MLSYCDNDFANVCIRAHSGMGLFCLLQREDRVHCDFQRTVSKGGEHLRGELWKGRGQQRIDLVPLWKEIQHTVLYNTGAIGVFVSSLCKEGLRVNCGKEGAMQPWIDLVPLCKEVQHTVLHSTGAIVCKEGRGTKEETADHTTHSGPINLLAVRQVVSLSPCPGGGRRGRNE